MLTGFFQGLADLIYPKTCAACKKRLSDKSCVAGLICRECWGKIKRNLPPFCFRCGRHLEARNFSKNICPDCVKKALHFDRAFSPCRYEGVAKALIHELKYKNKDYLAEALSSLMIEFIREYRLPMDYLDFIVPVPLHKTRLREREFNQAEVLSKYIAAEFKKDLLPGALNRLRLTRTQTELAHHERFLNVKGSFSAAKGTEIKGKNILLIDDVLTTGATSSEAAYALKDAGAGVVFVLTLAN
ncbi:MAG: ComF family protein [Candidatus Omnitrophota bacterium]|jgi:ComF family protein